MSPRIARRIVHTDRAPRAIGPYCQAVVDRRGGVATVFCAGQIALDPTTMEIVPGDARAHCDRVMRNIAAVLEAAGMTFANAVRATVYVTDLADLPAVNEVYAAYVGAAPPPRSTVQVAGIPRGSRVEIEVTAIGSSGRSPRPLRRRSGGAGGRRGRSRGP